MHVSDFFGKRDLSLNRKEPLIGLSVGRSIIFHFVILVFTHSYSYLIVGAINNHEVLPDLNESGFSQDMAAFSW
jgi:hypothetical protein